MKLLYAFIFILLSHFSFGTTYYISPKGNDNTGNGSIGNPWQTLYRATTNVKNAGDIIHVNVGIYIEPQQCLLQPGVSIEGEGVASVIKSTLTSDWKELLSLRSPEGTNGNQHISFLKFDGQNLSTFWAIYITGRSNISIHDCTITDFKDRGVIFDGRDDNIAGPPIIYATGNSFYNNTVTNCAAYNTANGIYGRGCLNIGGQEGMLIHDNIIIQNQRPNGYNGWPIKYSNDGYLKGIKIYNNTLTKIPYVGNGPGENGWDFAIEFWNILGGMEIYGNTIEGGVDLVTTSKNKYAFGVWFHNNTLSQKVLNKYYESGLIFEVSTEAVLIENNKFDKISGGILFNAQEGTLLENIIIRKNILSDIGRKLGNGNNGSGINLNCGTLFGDNFHYKVQNFSVYDNTISAANGNAPYYAIEITGAAYANNIKIEHNTIKDFRVACLIANPASVLDSLSFSNNILSGNGNNNNPFFIGGHPLNYSFTNNTKSQSTSGSNPPFNLKQQVIRPLYYDLKRAGMLELISLLTIIAGLIFCRKENIYVFAAWLINALILIFSGLDNGLTGEAAIGVLYATLCIYGWVVWSKRDRKKHRITRITASSKNELIIQFSIFTFLFIGFLLALVYFKLQFTPGSLAWADAFIYATAFTGMWLVTIKKVESWYWWVVSYLTSSILFFIKHDILHFASFALLSVIAAWVLLKWKNRKIKRRKILTD